MFSIYSYIFLAFVFIKLISNYSLSCDLRLGSPSLAVAPPITAIGVNPIYCNRNRFMIETKFPR